MHSVLTETETHWRVKINTNDCRFVYELAVKFRIGRFWSYIYCCWRVAHADCTSMSFTWKTKKKKKNTQAVREMKRTFYDIILDLKWCNKTALSNGLFLRMLNALPYFRMTQICHISHLVVSQAIYLRSSRLFYIFRQKYFGVFAHLTQQVSTGWWVCRMQHRELNFASYFRSIA